MAIQESTNKLKNDSDWSIIRPEDWDYHGLWPKVQGEDEYQRLEVDPETKEEFVFVLKKAPTKTNDDNEKPNVVIKKFYYNEPFGGLMQKKWFFTGDGRLKTKVLHSYDNRNRITREVWFDENNIPEKEIVHTYGVGGITDTTEKTLKKN